jgi:hypothetical protein
MPLLALRESCQAARFGDLFRLHSADTCQFVSSHQPFQEVFDLSCPCAPNRCSVFAYRGVKIASLEGEVKMLPRKSILVAVFSIAAIAGPGAGTAFAGEVTGKGDPTGAIAHANSICVFSGHNDDPGAPLDGTGPNGPGGHSQSYGQENKLGLQDPHAFNPGDACRGGSNTEQLP